VRGLGQRDSLGACSCRIGASARGEGRRQPRSGRGARQCSGSERDVDSIRKADGARGGQLSEGERRGQQRRPYRCAPSDPRREKRNKDAGVRVRWLLPAKGVATPG
jgi:hypothetical protein